MRVRKDPMCRLASLALGGLALAASPAAGSDYRLSRGDTIELSIAGAPDLKFRAPIAIDGTMVLPLVGAMQAEDRTLAELRQSVQSALGSRIYRRMAEGGREQPYVISPDEITLTIAEYRPITVSGDISKPGDQVFRPGMTVRHAVAGAGGYDFVRFRMENPILKQADLKSEYEALWIDHAKDQATVERLKAELAGKPALDRDSLIETPLTSTMTDRIVENEGEQLSLRNKLHRAEAQYLDGTVAKETGRLGLLSRQQEKERDGAEADAREVARLEALFAKGAVPITRVVDARRSMLLSSTRLLQTIGEQARVERERDAMAHKRATLDEQRRVALLREVQDAEAKLAITRSKLQAAGDKLAYAGMLRSHLVNGRDGARPDVTISRRGEDGSIQSIAGSENAELLPGDVVEVALKQYVPGAEEGRQPPRTAER